MGLSIETKLTLKEMQQASLFETIRAINANASEEHLYTIFKLTVTANPLITHLLLYLVDENGHWECTVHHGIEDENIYRKLPADFLQYKKSSELTNNPEGFDSFNKIIPVRHKENVLGYALLGIDNEAEDLESLDLDFIEALSNIMVVAVENKRFARREEKQKDYKRQLELAKNVQGLLIPRGLPYGNKEPVSVYASYLPHHTVGGDYYDFIKINEDKFLLCIADVSGKGIPAAILMSNFQGGLRALVRQGLSLEEIILAINFQILDSAQGENFITAFFLEYDMKTHAVKYINAGHNPPFLIKNEEYIRLEKGTTILGGFKKLPLLETGYMEDMKNFFVFCFTDGFTETYNDNGDELGDDMLQKFISENIEFEQKEMHENMISLLNTFKGNQAYADDITLLSCKINF